MTGLVGQGSGFLRKGHCLTKRRPCDSSWSCGSGDAQRSSNIIGSPAPLPAPSRPRGSAQEGRGGMRLQLPTTIAENGAAEKAHAPQRESLRLCPPLLTTHSTPVPGARTGPLFHSPHPCSSRSQPGATGDPQREAYPTPHASARSQPKRQVQGAVCRPTPRSGPDPGPPPGSPGGGGYRTPPPSSRRLTTRANKTARVGGRGAVRANSPGARAGGGGADARRERTGAPRPGGERGRGAVTHSMK